MKNIKTFILFSICAYLFSCGPSAEEKAVAEKALKDSLAIAAADSIAVDSMANAAADAAAAAAASAAQQAAQQAAEEAKKPKPPRTKEELIEEKRQYDRMAEEELPELDNVFSFENASDRATSLNSERKIIGLIQAIKNGYHIDPNFLEIPKYTCRRCYHLVSKNLFIQDYTLNGHFEKCPNPNNRILQ